jgi:hypothetical protein
MSFLRQLNQLQDGIWLYERRRRVQQEDQWG